MIAIAGGGGVNLFNARGNAWTADYLKITGELDVDLRSNIAAEARAKIVYERLSKFLPRRRLQVCPAISHDTRDHPHARFYCCARKYGEAAFRDRANCSAPTPTNGSTSFSTI